MSTHITVLPKDVQQTLSRPASSLRPLRLPHPRTGLPALFVPNGTTLLEIHAIAPDASRSWFVGQSVVSDGKLLLMTPIDPAFLLIPFLRALLASEPQSPFKPTDDLLEELVTSYSPTDVDRADVATFMALDCVHRALRQLCETKDIPPDITVHRPSNERIIAFLKRRIDRITAVQEFPEQTDDIEPVAPSDSADQPSTTLASASDPTKPGPAFPTIHRQQLRLGLSTTELGPLDDPNAQSIRVAARIKIASEVVGTWVEEGLLDEVLATYDVSAYTTHAAIRAEQARAELAAATARAEAAEAGKSGKGKGAEKRKAGTQASRGVDKLKKANTKGMAALTTFFGKKE